MKRYFCVFLAVIMISLALAGCDNTAEQAKPTVVGTWTAQIDMAESVSSLIYTQTGAPTASVYFPVTLQLTIAQDGTYTLSMDKQMLDEQIGNLMNVLWNIVVEQSAAQAHKTTVEAQEALHAQGRSKELLMQQLDFTSFFRNTFEKSGVWKQSEGMLYFAESKDGLEMAEGYMLSDAADQLTITYETYDDEPLQKSITFIKDNQ